MSDIIFIYGMIAFFPLLGVMAYLIERSNKKEDSKMTGGNKE
jgi:hypothetical protein